MCSFSAMVKFGRHTAAWPVNNKLKLQNAFAATYARYPGTHGFEDGAAVQGLDKRFYLALVASEFNGVDLVGYVNDATPENIGHALHFFAFLAYRPHLDQHELAFDMRPFRQEIGRAHV